MKKTLAIVGTGRVGLPLALCFADHGFQVYGIDNNPQLLEQLRRGQMPFWEEGGEALLKKHLGQGFRPTADYAVVREVETIIVTLGTPVDEYLNPVYAELEALLKQIREHLRPAQLLVLRSTVAPTSTEYLRRYLETHTPLRVGKDFFLAYCPERIAEGTALQELKEIPQIVGALEAESRRRAAELFGVISPRVLETDATSAELAKLFCNMYRYIDFAIANEFWVIASQYGRNILEIIDLVNRDYKRGGLKRPGLTGGPCLYKDGFFLVNKIPFTDLVSVAWKINETVPYFLIEQMKKEKPLAGARVALLGLAFKKNIDDDRNSLSHKAVKLLEAEGCQVLVHDPYLRPGALETLLPQADFVLLATAHDHYRDLGRARFHALLKPGTVVCDVWDLFGQGQMIYTRERMQL